VWVSPTKSAERRRFRGSPDHLLKAAVLLLIGQRTGKRHEDDQSDDCDNDYHDDYFWVAETLTRDHECGGNVALASTECHDPFCGGIRPAEQPTYPKAQCDKQKSRKDPSCAEDL
jgi:hypothetical protein